MKKMITKEDGISLFSKLESNLFEKGKTKGQIWKLKANTVMVKGREDLLKTGLKSQHCTLEYNKIGFTEPFAHSLRYTMCGQENPGMTKN